MIEPPYVYDDDFVVPPPPKIFDSGDDDEDFWFYEIRILLAAIINTFDFKWKCLYNQWGL